jgi:hypothetical protein
VILAGLTAGATGAMLVASRGPVSLHVALVATAGCYAAGIALAVAAHRHTTERRSRP